MVPDISNIPQNDIGNYPGLYRTQNLMDRAQKRAPYGLRGTSHRGSGYACTQMGVVEFGEPIDLDADLKVGQCLGA